jgi:GntR family transcriptional repressor for pyruvate dehydrogenase complex
MTRVLSFEPPRKVTVVQSIVEQIVRQVQAGNLKAGDKLPSERQLIEMLQVSRSSVREALQGLAMMGVIESRAGQGSFISTRLRLSSLDPHHPSLPATLQRDMLLSLIEARRTIEGNVARLAAERATPTVVARLQAAFARYQQHEHLEHTTDGSADDHHNFHVALAEATGNGFFVLVVETLLRAVPLSFRESEVVKHTDAAQQYLVAAEIAVHKRILTAVEHRDPPAAFLALCDHMDIELRLVHEAFRNSEPS